MSFEGQDSPACHRIRCTVNRIQDGMSTSTKLTELSERQLYALRRRRAAGVHDPELTLRGALFHDLRRCSSERCRCRSGSCTAPTPT